MTFLQKIHGPVSTTMKLPPTSFELSSTFPIPPSVASTEKPVRSRVAVSRYVQRSVVDMASTSSRDRGAISSNLVLSGTNLVPGRPEALNARNPHNAAIFVQLRG